MSNKITCKDCKFRIIMKDTPTCCFGNPVNDKKDMSGCGLLILRKEKNPK